MWAVDNQTPYAVERTWGRDKNGLHEWIVAVKGTFDIKRDGSVSRADEQLEALLVPEYNGEPGGSSLRYEADLVGPKPTTDILINGTAYAPRGRPTTEFLVSLRLGRIHKQIKVVGHRRWEHTVRGLTASAAAPVAEVAIVYERAFGGYDDRDPDPQKQKMDARNPVGCGLVAQEGQPLPNFEYPGESLTKAGPAGFGAIAGHWSPRRELHGTYDEGWKKSRYPLLPEDWVPQSLLCSPPDQRPDHHLRGGELIELENLTPDGTLCVILPKIYLRFTTLIDHRTEEHPGRLTSVIIEPDHLRLIMVWQSTLLVRNDGDYLDQTIVSEKRRLR